MNYRAHVLNQGHEQLTYTMVTIEDVHFSIGTKKIIHGISGVFSSGKIHGFIGPNGAGKSTLLKIIARIWWPETGTVYVQGKDYRRMSRRALSRCVTLVQHTSCGFPVTVYDLVAMGRNPHVGRFRGLSKKDKEIIETALQETTTYELREHKVNELSGGESQLCSIARALATEAPIILLDEPTSDLDIKHALMIMDLLVRLANNGKTFLVSIHDLNLAKRYCDTISIISGGRIFFSGSPEEAFSERHMKEVFNVNVIELQRESITFLHFYT